MRFTIAESSEPPPEETWIRGPHPKGRSTLGEIVTLTQTRALTLIRFNGTSGYCSESELLSDINFKLRRPIGRFNPAKGSAFTFISCLIQNTLRASDSRARVAAERHVELDEGRAPFSVMFFFGRRRRGSVAAAVQRPAAIRKGLDGPVKGWASP
jgi:hypothetical protein